MSYESKTLTSKSLDSNMVDIFFFFYFQSNLSNVLIKPIMIFVKKLDFSAVGILIF